VEKKNANNIVEGKRLILLVEITVRARRASVQGKEKLKKENL
jgi:hypothetical protein